MSAPAYPFVSKNAELDAAIQEQDRLLLRLHVERVDPRFISLAYQVRNDIAREQAALWGTRPVDW